MLRTTIQEVNGKQCLVKYTNIAIAVPVEELMRAQVSAGEDMLKEGTLITEASPEELALLATIIEGFLALQ
jgi:hypothetical protein